jgi:hypothetical protein
MYTVKYNESLYVMLGACYYTSLRIVVLNAQDINMFVCDSMQYQWCNSVGLAVIPATRQRQPV